MTNPPLPDSNSDLIPRMHGIKLCALIVVLSGMLGVCFMLMMRHARRRRRLSLINSSAQTAAATHTGIFGASLQASRWHQKLNPGALVLTGPWLIANGFPWSGLAYIGLAMIFWPISGLISVYLLFRGTAFSWRDGERWGFDAQRFIGEQYFWTYLAAILVGCWSFVRLAEYALKH